MGFKKVVNVFQYLVLAATVVVVIALFTNDGSAPSTADGPVDGKVIYASTCASCHGADGSGNVGPALAAGAVVEAYPEAADQVAVITDGGDGMPAFADILTPEEIQAVTDYTRNEL